MRKLNTKGSTLVECIAALAIFSLATFILLSGFLTSANLIVKSYQVKENSNKIVDAMVSGSTIANVIVGTEASQSVTFMLGSTTYTVNGTYKTGTCDTIKLVEFISDSTFDSDLIPDTDKYVNGKWPEYDDFPNEYATVVLREGTTFKRDGEYFIAAQNLNIYPRGSVPTIGWWYTNNNCLVKISNRPVIQWNGGTIVEFYSATGGRIDWGDKVLWNGDYYVFTIRNQTWAMPPNLSTMNWEKIT